MKVLITGALGNLGTMCIQQAEKMGLSLRLCDLDTPRNQRIAADYSAQHEIVLGDFSDASLLPALVDGVDAIIHNAAILPPVSEQQGELAQRVNVEAVYALIDYLEQHSPDTVLIFPSSVTVFGVAPESERELKNAGDVVTATDNYTRAKIAVEERLHLATIPWTVLRVGVSVDARTTATDRGTFRQLLNVHPDSPLEYVHPRDVALAMCNAVEQTEARGKTLLLGGGTSCRLTHYDFLAAAFKALGIALPRSAYGEGLYYTHWMDSEEAQRLLDFQRHSFDDYQQEMSEKFKTIRLWSTPIRWLISPFVGVLLSKI
ncbi:MAG: NAD-dependent epimerase/dehydratase family protein [Spongiibacteraceae bacterium]